jgi:hypothetical protein
LLHSVINANASGGLQTDDYIGIVEFGTETHHTKAKRPVTFAARMLKMVVTEAADSTPVESPKPSENPKPSDNPKPSGSSAIRYGGKIITPVVLFVVLLVCA